MNSKEKAFWHRRSLGLRGYTIFGVGTKATLSIGQTTGLRYAGWREGEKIDPTALIAAVMRRRGQQVGVQNVNLSAIEMEGRYKGQPEDSMQVGLIFIPSKKEKSRAAFYRNIKTLAQRIAGDLAQREVIIEWNSPDRRGRTDSASPMRAPPPSDRADSKFCKWVREHSRRAQRDPSDACHVPKQK